MSRVEETVERPKSTRKDRIRMAILGVLTILVFVILFRSVPFAQVAEIIGDARPAPIILAVLLTATFPLLSAWRMQAVLGSIGCRAGMSESFSIVMACFTLSTLTPSKAGDVARAYFLRGRAPVSRVLGSVLAERLLDVLTLLGLCFVGSLAHGWRTLALASGALLAAGLLGTVALLAIRLPVPAKLRPKAERLLESMRVLLRRPGLLLWVLILTLANWLASIVQTWLLYSSLGAAVPFARVLAALPAAIFVGLLPITIAGMGTRDAALIRLLDGFALAPLSLGVGLLYSLLGYWLPGVVGIPFLRSLLRRGT